MGGRPQMMDQVDIAVDLKAIPPPLPEIVSLRQFPENPPPAPPRYYRLGVSLP